MVIVGCTTQNPHYNPLNPSVDAVTGATNNPPAYIPDTQRLDKIAIQTRAGAGIVTPLVGPYGPLVNPLAEGAIAVIGLVTAITAAVQSRGKNKAVATNQVLAEGIVKSGAQATVLEVASETPHFGDVANHINDATPKGQPTIPNGTKV